jgi:hypothetical protein
MPLRPATSGSFKKGHKKSTGSRGQIRSGELTQVLISVLNEIDPTDPKQRPKLYRVVDNLVTQATTALDKYEIKTINYTDKNGNEHKIDVKTNKLLEKGAGDLLAIKEIFDRMDGKPKQVRDVNIGVEANVRYESIDDVRRDLRDMFIPVLSVLDAGEGLLIEHVNNNEEDETSSR